MAHEVQRWHRRHLRGRQRTEDFKRRNGPKGETVSKSKRLYARSLSSRLVEEIRYIVAGYFWIHLDFQSDRNPQIIQQRRGTKTSTFTDIYWAIREVPRMCVCVREATAFRFSKEIGNTETRRRMQGGLQLSGWQERRDGLAEN